MGDTPTLTTHHIIHTHRHTKLEWSFHDPAHVKRTARKKKYLEKDKYIIILTE